MSERGAGDSCAAGCSRHGRDDRYGWNDRDHGDDRSGDDHHVG
jgi:hypothetical protein